MKGEKRKRIKKVQESYIGNIYSNIDIRAYVCSNRNQDFDSHWLTHIDYVAPNSNINSAVEILELCTYGNDMKVSPTDYRE